MPIEAADFIAQLDPNNPTNTDNAQEGAAQIRLTKNATVNSFPNIDDVVTATPADLNQLTGVLLSELMPTGAVIMWPADTAPNGWLLCDGEPIPPQFTALIALLGANTPDLANKFVRGAAGGGFRLALSTETENVGAHNHTYNAVTDEQLTGSGPDVLRGSGYFAGNATGSTTGENRPANTAMMYIIKT